MQSKQNYEAIIGTADAFQTEPPEELTVATATERLKETIPDAQVWRVDVYDGGGVGLQFETDYDAERVELIEGLETMSVLPDSDPQLELDYYIFSTTLSQSFIVPMEDKNGQVINPDEARQRILDDHPPERRPDQIFYETTLSEAIDEAHDLGLGMIQE